MSRFTRHLLLRCLKSVAVICATGLLLYLLLPSRTATTLQKVKSLPYLDLTPYSSFFQALTPNLVSAVIIFFVGYSWNAAAALFRTYRARFFWGPALSGIDLVICHGTVIDSRLQNPGANNKFRFIKKFRDGRTLELLGPGENILGDSEVRSVSYLINALSKYRRQPIKLESDLTCLKQLSRTCIALGSASSNEMTEIVLNDENNVFLGFSQEQDAQGQDRVYIVHKPSGTRFAAFELPIQRDLGLILKIRNSRFAGHYLFACAGVGDWGTSGAAWYLANKWRELDDMGEEFGSIVQVEIGSDESAKPIKLPEPATG